jgi:hypothetical protein
MKQISSIPKDLKVGDMIYFKGSKDIGWVLEIRRLSNGMYSGFYYSLFKDEDYYIGQRLDCSDLKSGEIFTGWDLFILNNKEKEEYREKILLWDL